MHACRLQEEIQLWAFHIHYISIVHTGQVKMKCLKSWNFFLKSIYYFKFPKFLKHMNNYLYINIYLFIYIQSYYYYFKEILLF